MKIHKNNLLNLVIKTKLTGQAVSLPLFISNAVYEQIEVLSDNILGIRSDKMSFVIFDLGIGRRVSMDL